MKHPPPPPIHESKVKYFFEPKKEKNGEKFQSKEAPPVILHIDDESSFIGFEGQDTPFEYYHVMGMPITKCMSLKKHVYCGKKLQRYPSPILSFKTPIDPFFSDQYESFDNYRTILNAFLDEEHLLMDFTSHPLVLSLRLFEPYVEKMLIEVFETFGFPSVALRPAPYFSLFSQGLESGTNLDISSLLTQVAPFDKNSFDTDQLRCFDAPNGKFLNSLITESLKKMDIKIFGLLTHSLLHKDIVGDIRRHYPFSSYEWCRQAEQTNSFFPATFIRNTYFEELPKPLIDQISDVAFGKKTTTFTLPDDQKISLKFDAPDNVFQEWNKQKLSYPQLQNTPFFDKEGHQETAQKFDTFLSYFKDFMANPSRAKQNIIFSGEMAHLDGFVHQLIQECAKSNIFTDQTRFFTSRVPSMPWKGAEMFADLYCYGAGDPFDVFYRSDYYDEYGVTHLLLNPFKIAT